jgi:hypothetical protein
MVGLQEIVQLIIISFDFFYKVTYIGLIISSTIGQYIVKYVVVCINFIYTAVGTIYHVAKILYEDYCIFLLDVMNKGIYVASVVGSVVGWLINMTYNWWEIIKNTCLGIYEFLLLTVDTVLTIVTKTIHCISNIPEVLKNFITLVGSGIWFALKLIPLGFVYTISMCVFLVGRSCEEIISIAESIYWGILFGLYGILEFFHDIPFEAHAGLILGMCILYLSVKHRTHIIHCFANLCVQTKYVLNCTWTSLEMLLLSVFTHHNNAIMNDESSESEESNDETHDDNSQRQGMSYSSTLNLRSRLVPRVEQGKANITTQHLLYQLEQEQESKLCIVCQDRTRCVIILPCRHLCLCTECCSIIQREHGSCPVCRQDVRRTMKIYV